MFWRRKSSDPHGTLEWWRTADAAAGSPTRDAIDHLATALTAKPSAKERDEDEAERQEEMLDGLRELVELAAGPLPVITTQHRVIGADTCHFIAPASLGADAGKLFLTSARAIFTGATPKSWPWHRLRRVERAGRDLVLTIDGDVVVIQCNTYGDALGAAHIAGRLTSTKSTKSTKSTPG